MSANATSTGLVTTIQEAEERFLPAAYCPEWRPAQNFTFHLSMLLFLAASAVPFTKKYYVVLLKGLYILSIVFMLTWGAFYWCTKDIVMWGILYLVQNVIQFLAVIYSHRTVKLPPDLEELYCELFLPFNVTRPEFKALVNQNCKFVNISPGDKYAVESHTTTDPRVSILISGSMNVTYKGIYLHQITERQMIDSAEWNSTKIRRGEIFQVTIEADDPCYYMCWNRERLQYYLETNPKLEHALHYIRGRDILQKVFSTTRNALQRSEMRDNADCDVTMTGIRTGIVAEDPKAIYTN